MLDVFVGITIACFIILGWREGIAKSLVSIALLFFSLFLATWVVDFFAKGSPLFKDPHFLGAIIVFLLVALLSYVLLDLLLMLLFRRIVKIIILGPLDVVGGLVIGGLKGVLICGIIFQLILAMPISKGAKQRITDSKLTSFSVSAFRWAYPYAKKFAPKISEMMKIDFVKEIKNNEVLDGEAGNIPSVDTEKLVGDVKEYTKQITAQEKNIKRLLKEQKLILNPLQTKAEK
jgi:uncharacterized membrane protein required for colicin V production